MNPALVPQAGVEAEGSTDEEVDTLRRGPRNPFEPPGQLRTTRTACPSRVTATRSKPGRRRALMLSPLPCA